MKDSLSTGRGRDAQWVGGDRWRMEINWSDLSKKASLSPKQRVITLIDFEQMRVDYRKQGKTTEQLIKDLVISGEIQSGFKEMKRLGLLECSLEAGVLRFPSRFDRDTHEAATWRLEHVDS